MDDSMDKKRSRDVSEEAELEMYSPDVKRLRENLLDSLDDDPELGSMSEVLHTFIKSFEEEITASPSSGLLEDLTSDSLSDLRFLFAASDDELGLPPTATELVRVDSDSSEIGSEFWEAPGYDSFEFGSGGCFTNYNGEYAPLDGLFVYSDESHGSGDLGCRPETLPTH